MNKLSFAVSIILIIMGIFAIIFGSVELSLEYDKPNEDPKFEIGVLATGGIFLSGGVMNILREFGVI